MAVTRVVMPKLSEAMETGKVIKWLKKEGDRVEGGDIIAEIETDKADVELESFGAGVLRKILVPGGERAPVGGLIAVIAEADEDVTHVLAEAPGPEVPAAGAPRAPTDRAPAPAERPTPEPERGQLLPAPGAVAPEAEPAPSRAPEPVAAGGRIKASPLARKIAERQGVDLTLLRGSGPGGRIVRKDVEAALTVVVGRGAEARAPSAPEIEYEDKPLSSMRGAIARRTVQAKGPVPHFYVTTEIAMDRASELREELNVLDGQPKISVTDMVVKACVIALGKHPGVNASFQGEAIRYYARAHIGLAVALEDGLITPVLRNCDQKSLAQIAVEGRDLVERARNRRLRPQELSGATFSVSNLGMFDVDEFSAIINPPEGAILAVGAVVEKPVVESDRIGVGRRMRVTLSCDHRAMDGAMGARFLQELKRLLEEPLRLLVS